MNNDNTYILFKQITTVTCCLGFIGIMSSVAFGKNGLLQEAFQNCRESLNKQFEQVADIESETDTNETIVETEPADGTVTDFEPEETIEVTEAEPTVNEYTADFEEDTDTSESNNSFLVSVGLLSILGITLLAFFKLQEDKPVEKGNITTFRVISNEKVKPVEKTAEATDEEEVIPTDYFGLFDYNINKLSKYANISVYPKNMKDAIKTLVKSFSDVRTQTDENEAKRGNLAKVNTYYFSTLFKLLDSYKDIESSNVDSKVSAPTLKEIEGAIMGFVEVANSLLNESVEADLLDASAEARVFRQKAVMDGVLKDSNVAYLKQV